MHAKKPAVLIASVCVFALAACSRSAAPPSQVAASSSAGTSATPSSSDDDSSTPKVPFGNKPCQTLTQEEQKSLGFNMPLKATASRTPDDLPVDNTCSYESVGAFSIEYTTRKDYEYQRDNLRKASHAAPVEIPGSFYDVLGNLWFAKNGYYVAVTNVGQPIDIEKTAAVIAAKL